MKSSKVEKAVAVIDRGKIQLNEALTKEFPLGTRVYFEHGRHRRYGTIVEWRFGFSIWCIPRAIISCDSGKTADKDFRGVQKA